MSVSARLRGDRSPAAAPTPPPEVEIRLVRTPGEFAATLELRRRVFGLEQDMVERDVTDSDDQRCQIALALTDDGAIGTGRLSPPTARRAEGHISWVAILPGYRGQGIGAALMEALLAAADAAGMPRVTLSAQTHALGFYERLGFVPYGQRFITRGVEHQPMVRHRP